MPAGAYPGQKEPVNSVGSWSYILARTDLPDDTAYRLAKALHDGHAALVKRLDQASETTPQSTANAAPSAGADSSGRAEVSREVGVLTVMLRRYRQLFLKVRAT